MPKLSCHVQPDPTWEAMSHVWILASWSFRAPKTLPSLPHPTPTVRQETITFIPVPTALRLANCNLAFRPSSSRFFGGTKSGKRPNPTTARYWIYKPTVGWIRVPFAIANHISLLGCNSTNSFIKSADDFPQHLRPDWWQLRWEVGCIRDVIDLRKTLWV